MSYQGFPTPPTTRKRGGGFKFGLLGGIAAGVAGGLALLRRAQSQNEPLPSHLQGSPRAGAATPAGSPPLPVSKDAVQDLKNTLKQRWEAAVAEGRVAARERETELRAQLIADRKGAQGDTFVEMPRH